MQMAAPPVMRLHSRPPLLLADALCCGVGQTHIVTDAVDLCSQSSNTPSSGGRMHTSGCNPHPPTHRPAQGVPTSGGNTSHPNQMAFTIHHLNACDAEVGRSPLTSPPHPPDDLLEARDVVRQQRRVRHHLGMRQKERGREGAGWGRVGRGKCTSVCAAGGGQVAVQHRHLCYPATSRSKAVTIHLPGRTALPPTSRSDAHIGPGGGPAAPPKQKAPTCGAAFRVIQCGKWHQP